MQTPGTATALVSASLLALTGCGGDEAAGDPAPQTQAVTSQAAPSDATSDASDARAIPDGRYVRIVTEADFEATGLSEELREEFLGADGEMPTAFEFDGERWTQYITNDAGVEEVGDLGTLEYDEEGRLVTTSQSTGCPGCVGVVAWELNGQVLDLALQSDDVDPIDSFVVNGEYTREG